MKRNGKSRRKPFWWFIAILLIAVAAAAVTWYYLNDRQAATAAQTTPPLQTAKVRTGDLVITANGSGNLLPTSEVAVAFPSGGILAELLVSQGDEVEAGQVLARLDDADARSQVVQAETNLRLVELKLADLTAVVDPAALATSQANLAAAEADLSRLLTPASDAELLAARENLRSAQDALTTLLAGPDPEKLAAAQASLTLAEINVRAAQAAYDKIAGRPDAGATAQAAALWQATTAYEKAQAEYDDIAAGATDDIVEAARSQVAVAQAKLDDLQTGPSDDDYRAAEAKVAQAQAQLDALTAGADASEVESAALNVTLARNNLENVQRALDSTAMRAPAAGTVMAINAQTGEMVGSAPIITLADLTNPQVRFWVEEADLISVAPGNPVRIVFEALADLSFSGIVERIDPALVTVDGTSAVQAWASVNLAEHPVRLLSGMTADVEIVAGEAIGAMLVPVQALRELAPGSYAVFVVQDGDHLELRPVTVGLRDFANAEILSGLAKGDVVSTGTVETE